MPELLDPPAVLPPEIPPEQPNSDHRINPAEVDPNDGVETYTERVSAFGGKTATMGASAVAIEQGTATRIAEGENVSGEQVSAQSLDVETIGALTEQLFDKEEGVDKPEVCNSLIKELGWHILDEDPESPLRGTLDRLWSDPQFIYSVSRRYVESFETHYRSEFEQDKELQRDEREAQLGKRIYKALGFTREQQTDISRSIYIEIEDKDDIEKRFDFVSKQFRTLIQLYGVNPDNPVRMYVLFGIRCFGRYSSSQLLEQIQDWDEESSGEKTMPLAVVATAKHDWNGAFHDQGSRYGTLHDEDETHPMRRVFVEVGSQKELTERLLLARRRYGKINGLFLGAHGSPKSAQLGHHKEGEAGEIDGRDVSTEYSLKRMVQKGLFTEEAEIYLQSCSSAAWDGWAEDLSETTGLDVIANPKVGNSAPLEKITDRDGRPRFRMPFRIRKRGATKRTAGIRMDGDKPTIIERLKARYQDPHNIDLTD